MTFRLPCTGALNLFLQALLIVLLSTFSSAQNQIVVPGTTLFINLPVGGKSADPYLASLPRLCFAVMPLPDISPVTQADIGSTANSINMPVSSCSQLVGRLLSTSAGKSSNRISRPAYIPALFHGTAIEIPGQFLGTCLNAGSRIYGVAIYLKEGTPKPELLTPVLTAISGAAFTQEEVVQAPATFHLTVLDIDVPAPPGKWSPQKNTDNWGHHDLVVRLLGPLELSLAPFLIQQPGVCAGLPKSNSDLPATTLVENPKYASSKWFHTAYETIPPPGTFVSALLCRDVASQTMIMVKVEEEGGVLREADFGTISTLLDSIGDAVQSKLQLSSGKAAGTEPNNQAGMPPPVVNPKPLSSVRISESVSQGLLISQVPPVYPALARQARIQGTVVLQGIISKDGMMESLELISGHPMLAPSAIEAVKQWRYKPYYLNGEPVKVETTINVNFILSDPQ